MLAQDARPALQVFYCREERRGRGDLVAMPIDVDTITRVVESLLQGWAACFYWRLKRPIVVEEGANMQKCVRISLEPGIQRRLHRLRVTNVAPFSRIWDQC